jgi:hypothetical protein
MAREELICLNTGHIRIPNEPLAASKAAWDIQSSTRLLFTAFIFKPKALIQFVRSFLPRKWKNLELISKKWNYEM